MRTYKYSTSKLQTSGLFRLSLVVGADGNFRLSGDCLLQNIDRTSIPSKQPIRDRKYHLHRLLVKDACMTFILCNYCILL